MVGCIIIIILSFNYLFILCVVFHMKFIYLQVGDRVLCWDFTYGMMAEFVEVHQSQCFPMPNEMTFYEANCIVSNYLTAYFAIIDFGSLRPGQSILIQAAAGMFILYHFFL